jgi:hypothetical protein
MRHAPATLSFPPRLRDVPCCIEPPFDQLNIPLTPCNLPSQATLPPSSFPPRSRLTDPPFDQYEYPTQIFDVVTLIRTWITTLLRKKTVRCMSEFDLEVSLYIKNANTGKVPKQPHDAVISEEWVRQATLPSVGTWGIRTTTCGCHNVGAYMCRSIQGLALPAVHASRYVQHAKRPRVQPLSSFTGKPFTPHL